MEVLFEYRGSRRQLTVSSGESLIECITTELHRIGRSRAQVYTANVDLSTVDRSREVYLLQKWSPQWECYVDVHQANEINDGDRLAVMIKPKPPSKFLLLFCCCSGVQSQPQVQGVPRSKKNTVRKNEEIQALDYVFNIESDRQSRTSEREETQSPVPSEAKEADLNEGEQYVRDESGRASWKLVPKKPSDDLGDVELSAALGEDVELSDALGEDVELSAAVGEDVQTQQKEVINESADLEPADTPEGTQHNLEENSTATNVPQDSETAKKVVREGSVEQDTQQEKESFELAAKQEEDSAEQNAEEREGHEHHDHVAKMDDATAEDVGNDNSAKVEDKPAEENPTVEDNPIEDIPIESHSNDNKPVESNGSGAVVIPDPEAVGDNTDNTNGGEVELRTMDIVEEQDINSQKGEAPEQNTNEEAAADGEVKKEAKQDSPNDHENDAKSSNVESEAIL